MASKHKKRSSSALDPMMAGFAAGAAAFIIYAMPQARFDEAVSLSGLPMVISAAQPPLGMTARFAVMAAAGIGSFLLVWLVLRALGKPAPKPKHRSGPVEIEMAPPRLRRADAHPDAPSRRPILAGVDLGRPFDDMPVGEQDPFDKFPGEEDQPVDALLADEEQPWSGGGDYEDRETHEFPAHDDHPADDPYEPAYDHQPAGTPFEEEPQLDEWFPPQEPADELGFDPRLSRRRAGTRRGRRRRLPDAEEPTRTPARSPPRRRRAGPRRGPSRRRLPGSGRAGRGRA